MQSNEATDLCVGSFAMFLAALEAATCIGPHRQAGWQDSPGLSAEAACDFSHTVRQETADSEHTLHDDICPWVVARHCYIQTMAHWPVQTYPDLLYVSCMNVA